VKAIKDRARHSRLERLRADLEALAREDPEGFAELNRTVARGATTGGQGRPGPSSAGQGGD
jgi:hypothetical protein